MQCNSINVMEEPVIITRNSHPAELDLPRAPQPPNGERPLSSAPQRTYKHRCRERWSWRHESGRQVEGGWVSQASRTIIHH